MLLTSVTSNFGRHIVNARILLTHPKAVNCDVVSPWSTCGTVKALSEEVAARPL